MSNRELPMMPWYPDQFASATSTWTFAERSAYRALLDVQWALGVLPLEEWRLARAVGMSPDEFGEVWPVVSTKFHECDGGQRNDRLEEHRVKAFQLVQSRRNGARITNAQRAGERDAQRPGDPHAQRSAERPAERSHLSLSPSLSQDQRPDTEAARNGSEPLSARSAPRRATRRAPADWTPEPVDQLRLKEAHPGVDLELELSKFRDHTFATARVDWPATWRNWVREADERLHRGRGMNGVNGLRRPFKAPLTTAQIESEIEKGWRDASGSMIPGKHPDCPVRESK